MKIRKRQQENHSFKWFGETEFIHQFISRLQKELDETGYDWQIEFWDTCTLPKECWQITIEFPDGKECRTASELDEKRDELLDRFFESKELQKVLKIFRWCIKPERNSVREVKIAYAVCNEHERGKSSGVLIYWL